jgi:hypothetical protein
MNPDGITSFITENKVQNNGNGGWMYRSTYSEPRNYMEVGGQLDAPVTVPQGKEPPDKHSTGR